MTAVDCHSLQLIFADRINHRLYITKDEGETYTRSNISFRPDRLTFQSRYAQNSMKDPYNKYVLGYDGQNRLVSPSQRGVVTITDLCPPAVGVTGPRDDLEQDF